jgi:hypothetical protein
MSYRFHKLLKNLALLRPSKFFHRINDKLGFIAGFLNVVLINIFHKHKSSNTHYSDKLTLSFDGFCRKKPKSECLVPSRQPDFAGMMRPGHDQSTPFGVGKLCTIRWGERPREPDPACQAKKRRLVSSLAPPNCTNNPFGLSAASPKGERA